jgi:hypothetical protein
MARVRHALARRRLALGPRAWASGERALEGGSVGGRAARPKHELDRQLEERAQRFEALLAGHYG